MPAQIRPQPITNTINQQNTSEANPSNHKYAQQRHRPVEQMSRHSLQPQGDERWPPMMSSAHMPPVFKFVRGQFGVSGRVFPWSRHRREDEAGYCIGTLYNGLQQEAWVHCLMPKKLGNIPLMNTERGGCVLMVCNRGRDGLSSAAQPVEHVSDISSGDSSAIASHEPTSEHQ
jgi:hypothetical protein